MDSVQTQGFSLENAASESATEHKPEPLLQHDAASCKPEPYDFLNLLSQIMMHALLIAL